MGDGLFTFGTLETVEVPSSGPQAANDAVAKAPLGVLLRWNGKVFRYVQYDDGADDIAAAAGAVCYWKVLTFPTATTASSFKATCDISSAIGSGVNLVAGVLGCVVTTGYYTWIQVGGVVEDCLTAASTVAGDACVYGTDSTFGRDASGAINDLTFGIALDTRDVTAGTNTVLLHNLIW